MKLEDLKEDYTISLINNEKYTLSMTAVQVDELMKEDMWVHVEDKNVFFQSKSIVSIKLN